MEKRCGNCRHFSLSNPDDETAGEGECDVKNWKGPLFVYDASGNMAGVTWGYHPKVLRRDGCCDFSPSHGGKE